MTNYVRLSYSQECCNFLGMNFHIVFTWMSGASHIFAVDGLYIFRYLLFAVVHSNILLALFYELIVVGKLRHNNNLNKLFLLDVT